MKAPPIHVTNLIKEYMGWQAVLAVRISAILSLVHFSRN